MNIEKENLLTETYQNFMETGLNSPESLNILDEIVAPDIMGFGTTVYERIFSIDDLKDLINIQREQSREISLRWTANPVFRKILKDGNAAVFVDDIVLEITDNSDTIKMNLRYSSVLEYQSDKWRVIHFHGSKPENVTTEEDTWCIEEWKKKNALLEKLIKERTAELEESLAALKSTQSQLIQSEKMASLGELTAGIAHEIQNPLNFVNNFSEVNKELLAEMKDEMDKGHMDDAKAIANDVIGNEEKISHHGKRADAIVKGMLQHSRNGSGQKELTDLNSLADEYLRLAYHGLKARDKSFNAAFELIPDPALPKVAVVPQDIGRVLLNLINNAFQAVNGYGEKPTVTVTTKKRNDTVEIKVADNGPGIPDNIRDKIFQPFFTTKPTGQGTGLGLSLSYDIVKAHGGELTLHTKEGEGTTFIVQLNSKG